MIPYRIPIIAPRSGSDWTEPELQLLRPLGMVCKANDGIEVAFGRTDEQDPWCTFQAAEEIICCLARIDRHYILSFPLLNRTISSTTLEPLIESAHAALMWLTGVTDQTGDTKSTERSGVAQRRRFGTQIIQLPDSASLKVGNAAT